MLQISVETEMYYNTIWSSVILFIFKLDVNGTVKHFIPLLCFVVVKIIYFLIIYHKNLTFVLLMMTTENKQA